MAKNAQRVSGLRPRVVVALFALLVFACNSPRNEPEALQGVVELDTVAVGFEVPGRVAEVNVHEGDRIRGRTVLARLSESLALPERDAHAAELEAARARLALLEAGARKEDVAAAAAELESVRAQEAVLSRQRARQESLLGAGAVPSSALDTIDSQSSAFLGQQKVLQERMRVLRSGPRSEEREVARAEVRALAATLAAMDERLTRYRLIYEGESDVLTVLVDPEQVVAAGTPAFTLADLDHPYVEVFVPQAELGPVKINAKASVKIDAVTNPVVGRVERIGSHTEFTPRYLFSARERANLMVRVRVRIDDPKHLLHAGVPAFVHIES